MSSFQGRLFTPHWLLRGQKIPDTYFKERIEFEIGEIVLQPATNNATINLLFAQAGEIKSLVDHANLWRLALIVSEAPG